MNERVQVGGNVYVEIGPVASTKYESHVYAVSCAGQEVGRLVHRVEGDGTFTARSRVGVPLGKFRAPYLAVRALALHARVRFVWPMPRESLPSYAGCFGWEHL